MNITSAVALSLVSFVATVSCGQRSADPPLGGDNSLSGYDGVWLLVEGRGPQGPIDVSGEEVTLEITGREVRGGMACNSYFATAEIDGERFRPGNVASTAIGCKSRLHEIDNAYLAALRAVETAERRADELVLRGSQADLSYQFVPPPPDAELVGTSWRIHSLLFGRGPASSVSNAAPASLIFKDDGTMSGSTSCRDFTARWEQNGDEISVQNFSQSGTCIQRRNRDQDQHLIEVLDEGFLFEIDGMKLEVLDTDGELGAFYSAPCRLKPAIRCRL